MTIIYSCIQEILGGMSKCLPTGLLITTEKSPDTDINFYTHGQIHTPKTHTNHMFLSSYWQMDDRRKEHSNLCFTKLDILACSVFFPKSPWHRTQTKDILWNENCLKCANICIKELNVLWGLSLVKVQVHSSAQVTVMPEVRCNESRIKHVLGRPQLQHSPWS